MQSPDIHPTPVNEHAIQSWLTTQLATQAGLDPSEITPHKDCAEYGLDSMSSVLITGDLEEWLGVPLPPTLLWDYPSIAATSRYITTTLMPAVTANSPTILPARSIASTAKVVAFKPQQPTHLLPHLQSPFDTDALAYYDDRLAA